MSSITDVVKEGLKYPFNDGKKVLTLGVIFLISSLVSLLMQYFVFDNMRILADNAPVDTIQAAISALPPSNMELKENLNFRSLKILKEYSLKVSVHSLLE